MFPCTQSNAALRVLSLLFVCASTPLMAQKPTASVRMPPPKSSPDSAPKNSTGPAPAADPQRGRYRVVLNGFTAYRQTYDHPLQIDGKGDEVYFATYVAHFDTSSAEGVDQEVVTSKVHGDVNGFPERKQVGLVSGRGGIKSGDAYPFPAPFKRVGDVTHDELPMLLWEGELEQGKSAVVLIPTVWEWDDNPELFAYWAVGRGALIERLLQPESLNSILNNRWWTPVEIASPGLRIRTNGIGDARDRPIGLDSGDPATDAAFAEAVPNDKTAIPIAGGGGISDAVMAVLGRQFGSSFAAPYEPIYRRLATAKRATNPKAYLGGKISLPRVPNAKASQKSLAEAVAAGGVRPTPFGALGKIVTSAVRRFGPQELYFFEKTIILTPAAIEDALRNTPRVSGRPAGVIDVPYVDTNQLAGRYVLHIQVERLP